MDPSETHIERQKRRKVQADRLRAERKRRVAAERQHARESGEIYVRAVPVLGNRVIPVEDEAGNVRVVQEGVVELLNLPERKYDYRVTIAVRGGDEQRAFVSELAIQQRITGPPISARGVQSERIGEVGQYALRELVGGELSGMSRDSARGLMVAAPRGRAKESAGEPRPDLQIVADACAEAEQRGVYERPVIRRRLAEAGFPHSESTVKRLKRLAVEAGLVKGQSPDDKPRLGRPPGRRSDEPGR